MAESVCAHLARCRGLADRLEVASAAAHPDEIGNPPHPGTREKLRREGIPLIPHRARLLVPSDGEKYDLLIGMDSRNVRDIVRTAGAEHAAKVKRLLDFSARPRDIADPWYTGDFEATYSDIAEGCNALLDQIFQKE